MPSPQYNSIVFTQEDWRVLDVLETRNLAALKGITDDMSKDITRALSEGVTAGKGMPDLSKAISEATGMAKTRADRMARTETINACVDAARSRYQELGVKEFEFVAASDDRLCDICASFNGKIYKLTDDAHLPPIHPNCRCAIAPIIGDRKEEIKQAEKAKKEAEKAKKQEEKEAAAKLKAKQEAEAKAKAEKEAAEKAKAKAEKEALMKAKAEAEAAKKAAEAEKKKAEAEAKKKTIAAEKAKAEKAEAEAAKKKMEQELAQVKTPATMDGNKRARAKRPKIPYTDVKLQPAQIPNVINEPKQLPEAVSIYTGSDYATINTILRKGTDDPYILKEYLPLIEKIDKYLANKFITNNIHLVNGTDLYIPQIFRGVRGAHAKKWRLMEVGGHVTNPGYGSWSTKRSVAESFAGGSDGKDAVLFIEDLVPGDTGVFMGHASNVSHEAEILKPRGEIEEIVRKEVVTITNRYGEDIELTVLHVRPVMKE